MKTFQHSAVQDEYELQRITTNLLALQLGFHNNPNIFHRVVESMKKSDLREFAANARDDIYSKMHARPRNRGFSNFDLQGDIDELLQERRSPQGTLFSPLRSKWQPEQGFDTVDVLRGMNRQLGLQISNYSTDITLQLIAACGIALSQRGQVIPYDCRNSLLRDCWLVYDRLERFPCDPNVDASPQSRWSALSPRINHVQPIRPPQCGPLLPVPPPQELEEILSAMKRIEQKIDLKLNIGFSGAPPGLSYQLGPFENVNKQLLNIRQQITVLAHQTNQVFAHIHSEEGAVGSRQQTDESDPPCTPAEQNSDDGQHISIASLCASLELLEPADHSHEALFMGNAEQQATKFD
ncbi:hypothetical protein FOPG_16739 [Fusarium oxysporum f. sp. conglutinans race 2 54008]|uniref:Uncharacterized protein n=3 Tax=Fusarium oxysporum f. sp. conglutinans TaxID=100902 RepID=A0A8H6GLQ0_FUSOX|nr:hypothetical protein FOXB_16112 [Fusarium oxysporum f. sp. conglutinans Fo5176]EXL67128.1 hypothetical protein FOPG_16739 [Fusarium oxysporum f. sp. conglutinans race 2 54008]KAF6519510.1 hypothetical protein HZS61_017884 [Fusarium oxysporum f. sp. conglutinans]KAG6985685.1 hypothetical protein FocnCong_v003741 [Fusarium oxysporum f. sp. conglutinans]KAI8405722.1 hypothetical protein FOFC_15210 [Fusarium oxysporum]